MAWLRAAASALAVYAGWYALAAFVCLWTDASTHWLWVLALALLALQWALAPRLVLALYRVRWTQHPAVPRRLAVLEAEEPWCMTFGWSGSTAVTLATEGLLRRFEDHPAQLEAVLARESRLAAGADLGAATALAAPLLWAGVTDEFFIGQGRQNAIQSGLGGGTFIGLLARAASRLLEAVAALTLRGRHGAADTDDPRWRDALRGLVRTLQAPAPTTELALRRAYAARAAILLPVDVLEAARLALLDADLEQAAAAGLANPWERARRRFHPLLGARLGLAPAPADPAREATWRASRWQRWLPPLLTVAGGVDLWFRHRDLGAPLLGLGLGWLLALRGRYPSGRPMLEVPLSKPAAAEAPWYPEPLLQMDDRLLPMVWLPTWPGGLGAAAPPATSGTVLGWVREEATPSLEALRIKTSRGVTVNHAILVRTLLAAALVGFGMLLNLVMAL